VREAVPVLCLLHGSRRGVHRFASTASRRGQRPPHCCGQVCLGCIRTIDGFKGWSEPKIRFEPNQS